MSAKTFLKAIWPAAGHYCIAIPHVNKAGGKGYKHSVHDTMDDAWVHTRALFQTNDVYFGIFTHIHDAVLNPLWGKMLPSRKRENMAQAKCLFLDLDVGKGTAAAPKYASQADGLTALSTFLFHTGLPDPWVVSSGNGLHVYWALTDALDAADWKPLAVNLRMLLDSEKVLYDPSRTLDTTSVLRMPKTLNHKDPDNLKEVKIIHVGAVTDTDVMRGQLALLTTGMQPLRVTTFTSIPGVTPYNVVGNISPHGMGFPPTDANDVAAECEQIRVFRDSNGNIPEPHWYAALGVVGFCTNGEQVAQAWSSGHPTYSQADTQAKLDQWKANGSVSSCHKLETDGLQGACQRCPHYKGQFKNPIVITNKKPVVAAQQAALMAPTAAQTVVPTPFCPPPVCDPPYPYERIASLGVTRKDSKGFAISIIEGTDLYPISVSSGRAESGDKVNFGVSKWIARERDSKSVVTFTEIEIGNQTLTEPQKLVSAFIQAGVFLQLSPEVAKYMSAYLKELKSHIGLMPQHAHLGWPGFNKYDRFILAKKVIDHKGQISPCIMAPQTEIVTDAFTKGGSLAGQISALKFYSDADAYAAQQFFILCSLGTPLFIATGHHGVVVNASGESAASKSTSLKAAAGIWANPTKFMVNGTTRGMSPMARDLRTASIPNLPTCIDEITLMEPEEARAMVMGATQAQQRITLMGDRTVRESKTGAYKAALMLTTANASLHQLVNSNNQVAGTANSARVLELVFDKSKFIHTKSEADQANVAFDQNFGWLGEHFMQLAMPSMDWLMDSVKKMIAKLNRDLSVQGIERFYISAAAPAFVAGVFAAYHGLIDWDIEALYRWFVREQHPHLRMTLKTETNRLSAANVMRDFLGASTLDTIHDDGTGNIPPANIRTEVVVHNKADKKELWVHRGRLRDFCDRRGVSYTTMIDELERVGAIVARDARRVLGEGTRFGLARAHVVILQSDHKAFT